MTTFSKKNIALLVNFHTAGKTQFNSDEILTKIYGLFDPFEFNLIASTEEHDLLGTKKSNFPGYRIFIDLLSEFRLNSIYRVEVNPSNLNCVVIEEMLVSYAPTITVTASHNILIVNLM